jgi:hypothetical protein
LSWKHHFKPDVVAGRSRSAQAYAAANGIAKSDYNTNNIDARAARARQAAEAALSQPADIKLRKKSQL